MAFWARQICIWCSSVKTSIVANSIQHLRKTHRMWIQLHEHSSLSLLCSDNHFLQYGQRTYTSVSLGSRLQSTNSNNGQILSSETNLLSPVNHCQQQAEVIPSSDTKTLYEDWDDTRPLSALEEISEEEAVQIVAEPLLPLSSFTLEDYVDRSETLSKLVLLGVDLSKMKKRPEAAQLLLRLDFEKDITKIILFLKDVGLEDNQLGPLLTKNPYILAKDTEVLETRVAYLKSKKFGKEEVARMVSKAPFLLSFSVERLDNRLGFLQKELGLNVQKTRDLVVRLPRLLTGSLEPIKENYKVCQLELGFRHNEIQHIVSKVPRILTANKRKLTETFDYLHNVMGITHHLLLKFPQVLNSKVLKVKERHMFLTFLGRAQYDPKQPSYISLDKLVSVPDEVFCTEIAKASVQDFEKFLKTL
uniref:Transcription termination factor 3, mitochondrial n=1 Tax=Pelusios castaneus TaxID=367368 RepID=A0A8C8RWZ9_9SAUR